MIAVLLVYGWRSLLAITQYAFLNKFIAPEYIQLLFTASQMVITTFQLGYEHSITLAVCVALSHLKSNEIILK